MADLLTAKAELVQLLKALGLVESSESQGFDRLRPSMLQVASKRELVYTFKPISGELKLVPLFDVHVGHPQSQLDLLKTTVDYILRTEDCVTFLGGDLMETATKDSPGKGTLEQRENAQEQRWRIQEILQPLARAGKILFAITGNHEMRITRYAGENGMAELAKDLQVPYCDYQAFATLYVHEVPYTLFVHHGRGSAASVAAMARSAEQMARIAEADLYVCGHTHGRLAFDAGIFTTTGQGQVVRKLRKFVVAGSFVEYFSSYAEEKAYPVLPVGPVLIQLDGRRKDIRVIT